MNATSNDTRSQDPAASPAPLGPRRPDFHGTALVLWLCAALTPTLLTRNPFYLTCCLAAILITRQALTRGSETASAWADFAKLSAFFVVFTLIFNVLLGGFGETELFRLPAFEWHGERGELLFRIGGPITLESLIYGLTTALALFAVIAALTVFNALVDHYQLLRGLPAFLYQAGTVVSIAITFMPQLVRAQKEIREAHALRGHRIRGIRDFLPMLITLLAESLDRAISLAESMEARGFSGPTRDSGFFLAARLVICLGLACLLGGSVLPGLFDNLAWTTWLTPLGGISIALVLFFLGRKAKRSRYRRQSWRGRDFALAGASLTLTGAAIAIYILAPLTYRYTVFPTVSWPAFNPGIALIILAAAVPVPISLFTRAMRQYSGEV